MSNDRGLDVVRLVQRRHFVLTEVESVCAAKAGTSCVVARVYVTTLL